MIEGDRLPGCKCFLADEKMIFENVFTRAETDIRQGMKRLNDSKTLESGEYLERSLTQLKWLKNRIDNTPMCKE